MLYNIALGGQSPDAPLSGTAGPADSRRQRRTARCPPDTPGTPAIVCVTDGASFATNTGEFAIEPRRVRLHRDAVWNRRDMAQGTPDGGVPVTAPQILYGVFQANVLIPVGAVPPFTLQSIGEGGAILSSNPVKLYLQ